MLNIDGKNITINENDFGLIIPMKVIDGDILEIDEVKFIVKNLKGEIIVSTLMTINEDRIEYKLSKNDSEKLSRGVYKWGILQIRDNNLVDTLQVNNLFTVEEGLSDGN